MTTQYLNLWKSTVRVLTDTITDLLPISPGLVFMNMDAHAEIAEWPNQDIVGLAMFGIEFDEHMVVVNFAVGVSTYEDPQLLRHVTIMDALVDKFKPGVTHVVLDAAAGTPVGWARTTNGTIVKPMERTESRPLQFIVATLATGLSYRLDQ